MKRGMRFFAVVIGLFFALGSCGTSPDVELIPKDKYVLMVLDMHKLYSIQTSPNYRNLYKISDSIDIYSKIFEKHGYSRESFDSTTSYYTLHQGEMEDIYNKVIMGLSQERDTLEGDLEVQ